MKKLSRFDIAVIVALVVGMTWFVFLGGDVFRSHSANVPKREALVRIHSAINVGDSYDAVLQTYWSHRTRYLQLFAESPEYWRVAMPLEFGASDWTLILEFRNARASAVQVRTSDSPHRGGYRPEEAPKDKDDGTVP
jgi:hypothetical protein